MLRIAVYLRLSKEDEQIKIESNSIHMQRELILLFVKKKFDDYKLIEYVDDGFTGTNFNRPGVTRLLDDVKNEKIDCIIVKDFSRFSRDYIELGSYLEQIFPFLGIRFISINDGYDSSTYQGSVADLDVNFKSLLYDLYSKDLSQKIKASLYAKKESGMYVSGNCPFGYQKAPDDRHMLLIKEDEAEIVRRIFEMTIQGNSTNQIAQIFNEEGIKTPVEFKIEAGETKRTPKGGKFLWGHSVIATILRNKIYVGDIEYGKTERNHVGGRNILKPRKEWKVYKNHHEPIICREIFDEIQKSRGVTRVTLKRTSNSALTGLLACSKCKRNLRYKTGLNPFFYCNTSSEVKDCDCVKRINVMFIEQVILYELEQYLYKQNLIQDCTRLNKSDIEEKLKDVKRSIETTARKYDMLKRKHYENYQSYLSGEDDRFLSLSDDITQIANELEELKEKEKMLQKQLHNADDINIELDKDILKQYIDCIYVTDETDFEIVWKAPQNKSA